MATRIKTATNKGNNVATSDYYTYLLDFENEVIAFLAENVTQEEAKRVAAETDCGHNQMVVVSHREWHWTAGEVDTFMPIAISKMTA